MYGTIFRMNAKPGQEQNAIQVFHEWERERKPKVAGVVAGFLFQPDGRSRDLLGVAIFKDKASYMANANDPAQDGWYRKLRELLQEDPAWEDGEYVVGSIS